MRKQNREFGLTAIIILLAIIAFSFVSCEKSAIPQVSVAIGKNIWCSLTILADHNGFFDSAGVGVSIIYQDAGKYCMDALIADQVEFANVVEVNLAYLGYTENRDLRIIGSVVESASCGIVASSVSGITVPSDLIGKSLAFSPGTGGELFAYRFLEHQGINRDQVRLRKIQPSGIAAAIVSGDIAAAASWEPIIYGAVKGLGGEAVVFRDAEAYTGYMFLAAKDEWAKRNPIAVHAFMGGLRAAKEFVKNYPEEAREILAAKLRVDIDLVETIWPFFDIDFTFDKDKMLNATTEVGDLVRKTQRNLSSAALPNYSAYFDTTYFFQD